VQPNTIFGATAAVLAPIIGEFCQNAPFN